MGEESTLWSSEDYSYLRGYDLVVVGFRVGWVGWFGG